MVEYYKFFYYNGKRTNYLVSNKGNIYSKLTNKILKPAIATDGRLTVCLRIENKDITLKVHYIVASTHIGPITNKSVNHINEDKLDNNVSNLEIIPLKDNLKSYLDRHPDWFHRKYSDELIHTVCKELKSGIHYRIVAEKYDIPLEYVYDIVRGTTRKRISKLYQPFPIEARQREGRRQNKELKNKINELIIEGKSNKEIHTILKLENNSSTEKIITRSRKKLGVSDPRFKDHELVNSINNLILEGKSNNEIRGILNCGAESDLFARQRKKLGLPDFNESGVPKNQQDIIMVLISEGKSNKEIRELLNIQHNKYSIDLFGRLRQKVKKKGSTTIENTTLVGSE